jgi:hypothetical protein
MLFADRHDLQSHRLILSPADAARQHAARRIRACRARDAAARLLAARRQAFAANLTQSPVEKG